MPPRDGTLRGRRGEPVISAIYFQPLVKKYDAPHLTDLIALAAARAAKFLYAYAREFLFSNSTTKTRLIGLSEIGARESVTTSYASSA